MMIVRLRASSLSHDESTRNTARAAAARTELANRVFYGRFVDGNIWMTHLKANFINWSLRLHREQHKCAKWSHFLIFVNDSDV